VKKKLDAVLMKIAIKRLDSLRVEAARAAFHAMYLVAFVEKEFGEI
jgi:hypothetical protein